MILIQMPDVEHPAGGVRVAYGMVDALNAVGHDAAIWHGHEGFRVRWFPHETRVVTGLSRSLAVGDVLVMPELGGARHQHLVAGARVVLLNQAHFYTMSGADPAREDPSAYPGWPNATGAIATSLAIERFLRAMTPAGFPVHHVPVALDDVFARERDRPRERRIAMLTHRRQDDLPAVATLLRRAAQLQGWSIDLLSGLEPAELAQRLGRAAVFVSMADHDGFGLPGAEAMAAGCRVVGFHGDGGREYLRPEFASPVDDPDLVGLRDAVVAAAVSFESDPGEFARFNQRASDFVTSTYTATAFRSATVAAFGALAPAAGQPQQVTARHIHWIGSLGQRRRRWWGASGRTLRRGWVAVRSATERPSA